MKKIFFIFTACMFCFSCSNSLNDTENVQNGIFSVLEDEHSRNGFTGYWEGPFEIEDFGNGNEKINVSMVLILNNDGSGNIELKNNDENISDEFKMYLFNAKCTWRMTGNKSGKIYFDGLRNYISDKDGCVSYNEKVASSFYMDLTAFNERYPRSVKFFKYNEKYLR